MDPNCQHTDALPDINLWQHEDLQAESQEI